MKATEPQTAQQPQRREPEFMTVREFAENLQINKRDAYAFLQDVPGVIKLGPRMTRIPRAGFRAFVQALAGGGI